MPTPDSAVLAEKETAGPSDSIDLSGPTGVATQLYSILIKEIEEGRFPPGQRFPSERVLAERFGISRPSVREALTALLATGFLFRTVGRGTFVSESRSAAGPPLETRAVRQIGFWISASLFAFVQPGYNHILTGVGEVCRRAGCHVQFQLLDEAKQSLETILAEHEANGGLDGNLVVGGISRSALDRLRGLGRPLLFVDLLVSDGQNSSVQIDYASGIRDALEYLKALGHREIGFIGFPASQKYESFWQSLEALGLPYRPRFVELLPASDPPSGMLAGYQSTQKMIARKQLPTALVATNDYVAVGALEALAVARLAVPQAISVVGCDDLGVRTPGLTTLAVDLPEVGRIAARMLLGQIETGEQAQQAVVPVKLVVRSTTGPARAERGAPARRP